MLRPKVLPRTLLETKSQGNILKLIFLIYNNLCVANPLSSAVCQLQNSFLSTHLKSLTCILRRISKMRLVSCKANSFVTVNEAPEGISLQYFSFAQISSKNLAAVLSFVFINKNQIAVNKLSTLQSIVTLIII